MYNLLSGLRAYFKLPDVTTDTPIFRLHTTFTTVLLLTFSMIITWTQFVGQPIRCVVTSKNVPTSVVNTYCWITTTFTMPDAFQRPSAHVAYPGVANNHGEVGNQRHSSYYQWVCFVLFFQALMCYFPKWLWEVWEDGLMARVVEGLTLGLRTEEEKEEKKGTLVTYLLRHLNLHSWYTFHYWFCELLCFLNVILQMFLMDWFLKGDFFTYGLNVLNFDDQDQEDRIDNMVYVFPRMTKCTFQKFGVSGSIEKIDALCILSLNIINEKTYIFLWFWYIILGILTALVVLFRVLVICFPCVRPGLMLARNRMLNKDAVNSMCKKLSVGDWWILYMLEKNIDPPIYKEVIEEFGEKRKT